jgi:hypothetical protein
VNPYRAPLALPVVQPEPVSRWPNVKQVLFVVAFPLLLLGGLFLRFCSIIAEMNESQRIALGMAPKRKRPYVPPPDRDESLPPWLRYKNDRARRWDGYGD